MSDPIRIRQVLPNGVGNVGTLTVPAAAPTSTKFLRDDATWATPPGTATVQAQYVTLATDAGLTNERVLTAGTGITITDGGANSTVTIAATGGGGMTRLAQIVTTGSQATVDFTSISGSYNALKLIWFARDTHSGTSLNNLVVQVNADTNGAHYWGANRIITQTTDMIVSGTTYSTGAANVLVGYMPQAGDSTRMGTGELTIVGYASTAFYKIINGQTAVFSNTQRSTAMVISSYWDQSAAITQLTFSTNGTAFTDGSTFTLYGLS
jgi:hypothetical protein